MCTRISKFLCRLSQRKVALNGVDRVRHLGRYWIIHRDAGCNCPGHPGHIFTQIQIFRSAEESVFHLHLNEQSTGRCRCSSSGACEQERAATTHAREVCGDDGTTEADERNVAYQAYDEMTLTLIAGQVDDRSDNVDDPFSKLA